MDRACRVVSSWGGRIDEEEPGHANDFRGTCGCGSKRDARTWSVLLSRRRACLCPASGGPALNERYRPIRGALRVLSTVPFTIEFTGTGNGNGRVHGTCGWNRYSGRYELSGAGIAIRELSQTRMACDSALMQQEEKVLDVLSDASRFARSDTGALLLYAEPGQRLKAFPSENNKARG